MDLILWRHAEALDARPGQSDLERALTTKGERQAQRMAEWLGQRIAASTRIVASPALRTQQTAQALGRRFETVQALAPDARPDAVLRIVGWPGAAQPVLVVGHQPTLGMVAALLLGGAAQSWSVKKGAVWWLRSREGQGENVPVLLQAMQAPDGL